MVLDPPMWALSVTSPTSQMDRLGGNLGARLCSFRGLGKSDLVRAESGDGYLRYPPQNEAIEQMASIVRSTRNGATVGWASQSTRLPRARLQKRGGDLVRYRRHKEGKGFCGVARPGALMPILPLDYPEPFSARRDAAYEDGIALSGVG